MFVFNLIIWRKKNRRCGPKGVLFVLILKRKIVTEIFHLATKIFGLCFAAKEKIYSHFLATTFSHLATEKKSQSPVGACLKKLISDPAGHRVVQFSL